MEKTVYLDGNSLTLEDVVAICRHGAKVALTEEAKKAIQKAFQNQLDGKGFSMVEIVTSCPTNWGLSPVEAMEWLEKNMIPYYPLGVYKDKEAK